MCKSILRLMAWCLQAPHHTRQRTHLPDIPEYAACPPYEVLRSQVITEKPSVRVLPDEELDRREAQERRAREATAAQRQDDYMSLLQLAGMEVAAAPARVPEVGRSSSSSSCESSDSSSSSSSSS